MYTACNIPSSSLFCTAAVSTSCYFKAALSSSILQICLYSYWLAHIMYLHMLKYLNCHYNISNVIFKHISAFYPIISSKLITYMIHWKLYSRFIWLSELLIDNPEWCMHIVMSSNTVIAPSTISGLYLIHSYPKIFMNMITRCVKGISLKCDILR